LKTVLTNLKNAGKHLIFARYGLFVYIMRWNPFVSRKSHLTYYNKYSAILLIGMLTLEWSMFWERTGWRCGIQVSADGSCKNGNTGFNSPFVVNPRNSDC
jgi:hypothetical protein